MRVLVTGGAGYIGSHAVKELRERGHGVVVLDHLERGHRDAVPPDVALEERDLRHTEGLADALVRHGIECVMHFAAFAYVGESMESPLRYYHNNVGGSVRLLEAMQEAGVERMVFSSTCATYGEPRRMPITEDTPQEPINPYGRSKLAIEWALRDWVVADPACGFAALRYFNVAGCADDGSLGERHEPETHIVPILLQVALGEREAVTIFGDDYDTPDGTCIRDYVHVEDLVDAHVRVMEMLRPGDRRFYNLGSGRGYSVKELVEAVRRVTGRSVPVKIGPRRPGDPPQLYASAARIERELGWTPRHRELDGIVESAWRWLRARGASGSYG